MAMYLVIEPKEKWSLSDLKVFYRIVRGYNLAVLTEEEETKNALEDYEFDGSTEYCFDVSAYPSNAFDAERVMMKLIGKFSWMTTNKKPSHFRSSRKHRSSREKQTL